LWLVHTIKSLVSPTPRTSTTTSSHETSQVASLPSTSYVTPPPSIRGVDSPSVSQPSHLEEPTLGTGETITASETQSNVGKIILFLNGKGYIFTIYYMRNDSNTHFSTLSLAVTLLLDEINACLTTLCGFNFQSVDPNWFKSLIEWVL